MVTRQIKSPPNLIKFQTLANRQNKYFYVLQENQKRYMVACKKISARHYEPIFADISKKFRHFLTSSIFFKIRGQTTLYNNCLSTGI